MHFPLQNYLSISSMLQLLLALIGLYFAWFWWSIGKGLKTPNTENRQLRHPLFSHPIYRHLFRLHQYIIVRAMSFTLAIWPLLIATEVIPKLIHGYIPYIITSWDNLYICFAISAVTFFVIMRNQGLSLRLDENLSISWDADDSLALHLSKKKIDHLSPDLILTLVASTERHQKTLSQQGINASLNIASWLLAPGISRRDPAVKKFRKTLSSPGFILLLSSHRMRHLRFLSVLLWLIIKSPLICYRLYKLPKPTGHLTNGLFQTRYTPAIETALNTLKPGWRLDALPLERMTTFSVIAIVAYTPKVKVAISGWTAGVRLTGLATPETCLAVSVNETIELRIPGDQSST
jgi:hypothetical protein